MVQYFFSGVLVLFLSWAMTGCRFGNRVEQAANENPDKITGYYYTQPQSLKFCTSLSATCASAPTNEIPAMVSAVMSYPVALLVNDLVTGDANLFSPFGNGEAFPIVVDTKTLEIFFHGEGTPSALYTDPSCLYHVYGDGVNGRAVQSVQSPFTLANGKSIPISGRIQMQIQIIEAFEEKSPGSCKPTLQIMSDCYGDSTLCEGVDAADNEERQAYVHSVFNPYIQSGALQPSDIPTLKSLGYEVSYE